MLYKLKKLLANPPSIIIAKGMLEYFFIKTSTKTDPFTFVNICHQDLTTYFVDTIFV